MHFYLEFIDRRSLFSCRIFEYIQKSKILGVNESKAYSCLRPHRPDHMRYFFRTKWVRLVRKRHHSMFLQWIEFLCKWDLRCDFLGSATPFFSSLHVLFTYFSVFRLLFLFCFLFLYFINQSPLFNLILLA